MTWTIKDTLSRYARAWKSSIFRRTADFATIRVKVTRASLFSCMGTGQFDGLPRKLGKKLGAPYRLSKKVWGEPHFIAAGQSDDDDTRKLAVEFARLERAHGPLRDFQRAYAGER